MLRTAIIPAAIVGENAISLAPAMAIPIRGVRASIARTAESGPRPQGPFNKTAGVGSGTSVAKGRPMAISSPTSPCDWLVGMKH